jgi:transcriptional regulator GlxA family with amidase domain
MAGQMDVLRPAPVAPKGGSALRGTKRGAIPATILRASLVANDIATVALGHLPIASSRAVISAGTSLPSLAAVTARYLIVDTRVAQSAYAILDHLAHADPLVQRFEHWAREHLAEGFSLEEAAQALATSKRTLARRIGEVLGRTPLSYFQDLRVERAVHLLRTSSDDVEAIAASVGYADGVTLRNLLRRRLGHGVREIRATNADA